MQLECDDVAAESAWTRSVFRALLLSPFRLKSFAANLFNLDSC